jgi:hypothetical protein
MPSSGMWHYTSQTMEFFIVIAVKPQILQQTKQNKRHGLTDQGTAACWRSDCQFLRIKGATWSVDPYGRILGFLDRSRYFSIK